MKKEKRKNEKLTLPIISFILFIIVMIMFIFCMYVDITGLLIVVAIWIGFVPFMASIVLAIISTIVYFKEKKDTQPTKSRTVLTSINIVQLILCIVLIFNFEGVYEGVFDLKSTINFSTAKKELDKLYSNNYEIIDTYHFANTGGTNEIIAIIKLKNEDMYSLCKYDLRDKEFIDYYNNIKKAEQINLDKYFEKDIVWVGSLSKSDYDNSERLDLSIIVNYNDYSIKELGNSIINIAYDHILKSEKNSVDIRMFFTDNIDYSKMDEYKLLLISQLEQGFYDDNFFEKYNNKLVYGHYYDDFLNSRILENQECLEEICDNLGWTLSKIDNKIVVTDELESNNLISEIDNFTKSYLGVNEINGDTDIYDISTMQTDKEIIIVGSSYSYEKAKEYANALGNHLVKNNKNAQIMIRKHIMDDNGEIGHEYVLHIIINDGKLIVK